MQHSDARLHQIETGRSVIEHLAHLPHHPVGRRWLLKKRERRVEVFPPIRVAGHEQHVQAGADLARL